MAEHLVAIFGSESVADAAARDLENAGIPAAAIRRYRSEGAADSSLQRRQEAPSTSTSGGFWAWLMGENAETTRSAYVDDDWYDRRAQAGNAVLSVTIHQDAQIHQAVAILESHKPLEMEESGEEQSAVAPTTETFPSAGMGGAKAPAATTGHQDSIATEAATAGPATSEAGSRAGKEEVIPLAEEDIEIGKRTIDRGTTRVRRYVVETPVERDVTLHGERVTIERRRAAEPVAGAHAFEERTVEVRETEEVPVVEKTSRVVEEVAIRKEETERTETVRDKVRREEVEVTGHDREPNSTR